LKNSSAKLIKLMDNESFVRWISGDAGSDEIEKWEKWSQTEENHQQLVNQAKFILQLPFLEHECPNIELELLRLQKIINERV
jgi:hypothetical protein